jgi:hypothetical protein
MNGQVTRWHTILPEHSFTKIASDGDIDERCTSTSARADAP